MAATAEETEAAVVLTEVRDGVARVTLNRPARRNAISALLLTTLVRAMTTLNDDEAVQAIVITGSDPAFCAGVDLAEAAETGGALAVKAGMPTTGMFHPCRKPVIGAINGPAVAGGLELALTCDFLLASERAMFADAHARVGVMPLAGLSVRLPRWVGLPRAKQMSLTGAFVDADTACRWGLVNEVVPHDHLLPRAHEVATAIVAHDPATITHLRAIYDQAASADEEAAWRVERQMAEEWMPGEINPGHIAKRRDALISTGSAQLR